MNFNDQSANFCVGAKTPAIDDSTSALLGRLVASCGELTNSVNRVSAAVYVPRPTGECKQAAQEPPESINDYLRCIIGFVNEQSNRIHGIASDMENNLGEAKIA